PHQRSRERGLTDRRAAFATAPRSARRRSLAASPFSAREPRFFTAFFAFGFVAFAKVAPDQMAFFARLRATFATFVSARRTRAHGLPRPRFRRPFARVRVSAAFPSGGVPHARAMTRSPPFCGVQAFFLRRALSAPRREEREFALKRFAFERPPLRRGLRRSAWVPPCGCA